jgi:membrane protease YdiL (CAAX protease family)
MLSIFGTFVVAMVAIVGYILLTIDPALLASQGTLGVVQAIEPLSKELPPMLVAFLSILQFSSWVFVASLLICGAAVVRWRRQASREGRLGSYVMHQMKRGFGFRIGSPLPYVAAVLGGFAVGWFPGWLSEWMSEAFPALVWGNLEMIGTTLTEGTVTERLAMGLVIALIGPIAEELVFRGYMWDALERFVPPWAVLVFTSVVFAGYHMEPVHVVPILFTGFFLGWLRLTSGSIFPAIIVHVINNSLGVLSAFTGFGEAIGDPFVVLAALFTVAMAVVAWRGRISSLMVLPERAGLSPA